MTLILLVIFGSWFDADDVAKPSPAPAVKPSQVAIEAKPVVTLVVTPNCQYCDIQADRLKEIGVKYQVRIETAANNRYAGYPVLELPGRTLHGLRPKEVIEQWLKGAK